MMPLNYKPFNYNQAKGLKIKITCSLFLSYLMLNMSGCQYIQIAENPIPVTANLSDKNQDPAPTNSNYPATISD